MSLKNIFNPFTGKLQKSFVEDPVIRNSDNIMLNAFRIAVNGALSIFNMIDGIVDEYEDESGIDTGSSINESYNSTDDYYLPLRTSAGIDADTQLMLHCDGTDGSTSFPDSSLSPHTVTANGNAEVDTAIKKWGTGGALLDGNSSYLSVPDSSSWDLVGSLADNWTIDLWVRMDSLGTDSFMSQQAGGSDWNFTFVAGVEWGFRATGSGLSLACIESSTAGFSISTWYHLAVCKVGNEWGIYQDGVQKAYTTQSGTDTFSAPLTIGGLLAQGRFFEGVMDEIRFQKSNVFIASPNVGLTDTIDVPTGAYSTVSEIFNMTLISDTFIAESNPTEARLVILEEDIDSIILNTDLKAWASEDDGVNWHQVILAEDGSYDADKRILTGSVDLVDESDTDMIYKLTTHNEKDLRLHATALSWNS